MVIFWFFKSTKEHEFMEENTRKDISYSTALASFVIGSGTGIYVAASFPEFPSLGCAAGALTTLGSLITITQLSDYF